MLIGDGVTPGNEGRGYVLRRIMRRAIRNMRLLGATGPVVADLIDTVIKTMGQQYPELVTDRKRIETVALAEEAAFLKTLKAGTNILDTAVTETKAAGGTVLAGDKAFLLHDTWGFPIDLTLEMAAEQGLSVDEDGFRRLMKEQRERAKADAKAKKTGHADLSAYREIADSSRRHRVHRLHAPPRASPPSSASWSTASPRPPPPRATRSRSSSTAPRSTPRAAASSPTPAGSSWTPAPSSRSATCQQPVPGVHVHKGVVQVGEVTVGAAAYAPIDVRPPPRHRPRPQRHPPHPPGAARRPRPDGRPGRFGELAGPLPLRLRLARPPYRGTVLTDVEQKINEVLARELDVARRGHEHRRGQEAGRHRRVRREVRRARARRHHRRLLQGAVRRHARAQHRPARPGEAARRVVHRLRRAPCRGPGRRRRLQLPRPGAHGRRPAHGAGQGPPGGAARRRSPPCSAS